MAPGDVLPAAVILMGVGFWIAPASWESLQHNIFWHLIILK